MIAACAGFVSDPYLTKVGLTQAASTKNGKKQKATNPKIFGVFVRSPPQLVQIGGCDTRACLHTVFEAGFTLI